MALFNQPAFRAQVREAGVSILVFMDGPLQRGPIAEPNGSGLVSILVFMDGPLQLCSNGVRRFAIDVSILVFMDGPLQRG